MPFTRHKPLRVGTDCSGIEVPIVALKQMKIPFIHEFSSEIDKHCISTIKANFHPKIIFGDMRERRLKDIPDIDLYVCGFPCQTFSIAGKREGVRDPRGTIFWECVRVIRYKKPMIFVLENVKGLLSIDDGKTFQVMMSELKKLKIYNIYWKILNTADYGIPQSRKRVFIVGILKKQQTKEFQWPEPIPCQDLDKFIDWNDTVMSVITPRQRKQLEKINKNAYFIDFNFNFHTYPNSDKMCPTLTTRNLLFNCKLKRYMNVNECLKLQGFPITFRYTNSDPQMKKQIGNSMSVNVLIVVFKSIFQMIK
jgi:DNA (cytosine-5)-methyltransferase 1